MATKLIGLTFAVVIGIVVSWNLMTMFSGLAETLKASIAG